MFVFNGYFQEYPPIFQMEFNISYTYRLTYIGKKPIKCFYIV